MPGPDITVNANLKGNIEEKLDKIFVLSENTERAINSLDKEITELGRNDAVSKLALKMKVALQLIQRDLKETRMEALKTKLALDSLGGAGAVPGGAGAGFGGGGGGGMGTLGRLGGGAAGLLGMFGPAAVQGGAGLLGAAGGLIGGAIPLAGAGLATAGGAVGLYGAAAAGAYPLMKGIGGAMELSKYQQATGGGKLSKSQKARMEALGVNVTPAAEKAADAITKLQKSYIKLFETGERGRKQFSLINDSLEWLSDHGLPLVTRLWDTFFPVIDKNIRRLEDFFSSRKGSGEFKRWVEELAPVGNQILRVVGAAGHLAANLAADFAPLATSMGGGLAKWLGDKADWAASVEGMQKIQGLSNSLYPLLKGLGDVAGALGEGLVQLTTGKGGVAATYVLEHLATVTIPAFVKYIEKGTDTVGPFVEILGKLAHAFGEFFGAGSGVNMVLKLLNNMATVLEKLSGLVPKALTPLLSALLLFRSFGGGAGGGAIAGGSLAGFFGGPLAMLGGAAVGGGMFSGRGAGGVRGMGPAGAISTAGMLGAAGAPGGAPGVTRSAPGWLSGAAPGLATALYGRAAIPGPAAPLTGMEGVKGISRGGVLLPGGPQSEALMTGQAARAGLIPRAGAAFSKVPLGRAVGIGGATYIAGQMAQEATGSSTVGAIGTGAAGGAMIGAAAAPFLGATIVGIPAAIAAPAIGAVVGGGIGAATSLLGGGGGAPAGPPGPAGMFGMGGFGLLGNEKLAREDLLRQSRSGRVWKGGHWAEDQSRIDPFGVFGGGGEHWVKGEFTRQSKAPFFAGARAFGAEEQLGQAFEMRKEQLGPMVKEYGRLTNLIEKNADNEKKQNQLLKTRRGIIAQIAATEPALARYDPMTGKLKGISEKRGREIAFGPEAVGPGGGISTALAAQNKMQRMQGATGRLFRNLGGVPIGQREEVMNAAATGDIGALNVLGKQVGTSTTAGRAIARFGREVIKTGGSVRDFARQLEMAYPALKKFEQAAKDVTKTGLKELLEGKTDKLPGAKKQEGLIERLVGSSEGKEQRRGQRLARVFINNMLENLKLSAKQKRSAREAVFEAMGLTPKGNLPRPEWRKHIGEPGPHKGPFDPRIARETIAEEEGEDEGAKRAKGAGRKQAQAHIRALRGAKRQVKVAGKEAGEAYAEGASGPEVMALLDKASQAEVRVFLLGGSPGGVASAETHQQVQRAGKTAGAMFAKGIEDEKARVRKASEHIVEAAMGPLESGGGGGGAAGGGGGGGGGGGRRGKPGKRGMAAGGRVGGGAGRGFYRGGQGVGHQLGAMALNQLRERVQDMQRQPGQGAVPGVAGLTTMDGHPVAKWIARILQRARGAGVDFRVESGYRSRAEQAAIYASGVRPAAVPGTSHHEGMKYPSGAVDISGYSALNAWLQKSRYKGVLQWAGGADPVHFSHQYGGGYAAGGRVHGPMHGQDSVDARLSPEEFVVTGDGERKLEALTGTPGVLNWLEGAQRRHFAGGGRARVKGAASGAVAARSGAGGVSIVFTGDIHLANEAHFEKFANQLAHAVERKLRNLPEGAAEMTHAAST